jgi:diguanylate cyclase (GGDEF)-like protein
VVSVSYPVMDVAVLVLTVLTLARARADTTRLALGLLAVGLMAISVADSAFVYLAATDSYQSGDPIDNLWNVGFGCLGLAALLDAHPDGELRETTTDTALPGGGLLPYLPVAGALLIVIVTLLTGYDSAPAEEAAVLGLILLLLARQYLTLRQNARLVVRLAARERELRHLAFHDALTGLPNRALFRNRLEHALDLHSRDGRALAVLFLDLDDFKEVNDTLGHTAGDHLLIRIAERLHGATRTGDTVARLGGDEFAVLLETGGDPCRSAERLTGALRDPFFVAGHTIEAKASIGVVRLTPRDPTVAADELLIRADTAMYAAKRSHRTIAVHGEHS